MSKILLTIASLFLILSFPINKSDASSLDIGLSIGDEGLRGFYIAVGDYYRIPQRDVIIIKERGIPYYEIPVVLFIAQRARVSPEIIIDMRLRNMTWMSIMLHYRLSPEILYIPVKKVYGPPYGKAYGYYKSKPRKEWKKIVLDDDDVVNLVNLRFISTHYKYPPETIIEMRSKGKEFIEINENIRKEKKGNNRDSKRSIEKEMIKEKGKNKDKDKGGKQKGKD